MNSQTRMMLVVRERPDYSDQTVSYSNQDQNPDRMSSLTAGARIGIIEQEIRQVMDNAIMNMIGIELNFTVKLYKSQRSNFTMELVSKYIRELNSISKGYVYTLNTSEEIERDRTKMMNISYVITYK